MKKLIAFFALTLSLQGCIFVAGAAAGAAAIAIVYDHRTLQNAVQDTQIANAIINKIRTIPALKDDSHIEVTVFNRVVLLTGETPDANWRQQAEEIAKSVPDVSRVYNQLALEGPTSTLTRTSDSWITTKIKSQMLATDDLKSSSIKVVTENGVVYLIGIVNRDQADTAVDIARQVVGVQKVVKIFQYAK
ncbi:MAG: hypothetical protein A3F11_07775 [Gammaproteobacteria bacterium RIFCSPHIGHO2_12_FULL_37_14]|nr:MAG: hypothetical protein A3F11_07775 [Gammaproteobacteria bacterium RIFCSPHIGHO2_12_FULL_37_14]